MRTHRRPVGMTLSAADRLDLSDLVHRYAADIDDRDFTSAAMLFTADAELTVPAPPKTLEPVRAHQGRSAIAEALAAVAAVDRTEHGIIGEVYDPGPRPGAGYGRITCVAHHWTQGEDKVSDVVWHIRYRDEYRLTDDGWRIHRRSLTLNGIETRDVRRVRPPAPPS